MWAQKVEDMWFLIIFQALEPRYDPISDARRHMNYYFNFGAVIVYVPMSHLIQGMGDNGFDAQIMWKIAHFFVNFMIF